jgi:hypothetical protein
MTPRPIPLIPSPDVRRAAAVRSLTRACIATGICALDKSTRPGEYLKRTWSDDHLADMITRASVAPATLAGNTALAQVAASFLDVLTPMSAGADLLNRGVGLNFNGAAQINVPGIAVPTGGFVAEGAPIPVVQAATGAGPTLTPHKLALITTLTGEMMRNPNAEQLVRQVLVESCGPTLDAALFSATAASASQPAGLLNGITPLTAAASGSGKDQIVVDDLQKLVAAVAPVAGNNNLVIVASPDAAVALLLRVLREEWPILASSALAARTVIVVAANAIVSAIEGAPQIDTGLHTELHRETNPQPIVNDSGTVAVPVGSIYQTDQVALRLRWPLGWALRDSRGVAWMQNVNW